MTSPEFSGDDGSVAVVLQCPSCRSELNLKGEVERLEDRCPVCHAETDLIVFPRLYRELDRSESTELVDGSEARCTFYPELPAAKSCDECGCFLSEKASVRWGELDLCLPCLHRLREEKGEAAFVAKARLYDNRALALVTVFAPFSLFTAPVALFLLLRYRKIASTFEPRSRFRWWVALVLSIGWLVAWTMILVAWASLVLEDFS